jgi:hypothetical protein
MLGNGAANVSIVDNRGCVVLPADEVSLYSGRVSSLAHEDVFAPFPTSVLSKFVAASGARRRLEVFEPAHA